MTAFCTGLFVTLLTVAYHSRLDMVRALARKKADVDHGFEDKNVSNATVDSEAYPWLNPYAKVTPSFLRVWAASQLAPGLGADLTLCEPNDQLRIQRLLKLSDVDCKLLAAFHDTVHYEHDANDPGRIYEESVYRKRQGKRRRLVDNGADSGLCPRDDGEK